MDSEEVELDFGRDRFKTFTVAKKRDVEDIVTPTLGLSSTK